MTVPLPASHNETPHGFVFTNEDDGRTLTFDRAGYVLAEDGVNGEGYALSAAEARYLAAALTAFADDMENLHGS